MKSGCSLDLNKLASPSGPGGPIIAQEKPITLSLLNVAQRGAEVTRSQEDDYVKEPFTKIQPIAFSTRKTENPPTYRNYFASCDALLKSACSTEHQTKSGFPSSKSVSNISDCNSEEKGCLTDVHCGGDPRSTKEDQTEDEVEIISLLEEQIPKYKLRADTITKFGGYANTDFVGIPYPALQDYTPVTPEQAYLTLGYFLLSGERVSQMTKTYADVDAVQRLLEEKEKDLELAARIGQQLLEQNQQLQEKLECLESDYNESQETVTQLKHEIVFKTQLLELYDNGPSEEQSKATTPTPLASFASVLERRVAVLEDENNILRNEACRIVETVEHCEAEERYLVEDAIKRLGETNARVTYLSDELQKKTDETVSQQEEISTLEYELKELKTINKEIFDDNVELQKTIKELRSVQNELVGELADLKVNYLEVVEILKETQGQLREAQQQKESGMNLVSVFDSLAYEIENSLAKQRSSSDYFRRCFDMVRSANQKHTVSGHRNILASGSSSGYYSGFSEQPSLDSSAGAQDMMILVNPATISLAHCNSSDLSLCGSPCASTPGTGWRIPEKLQIVKPLEGSSTLQLWSSLATPHLGNLLDTRPGVKMRVERYTCQPQPGGNTLLALTGSEEVVLHNFTSTPPVFTFVTTSTDWNRRRDSTTTVYTNELSSNLSTYSLSSRGSSPVPSSQLSVSGESNISVKLQDLDESKDYYGHHKCETPQNSPIEGNSRPSTPPPYSASVDNRSFKTLYGMYDSILAKLTSFSNSPSNQPEITKPKCIHPVSKVVNTNLAPSKPGTGVLDLMLSDR